ncbi:MAG: DUF5615 family PIN-like protein [Chloroflexota bacterium]|nr:DUF5615 family PIN-like protein [Chloroflexota bacterium]
MYPPRLAHELARRGHDVRAVVDRPELRAMDDEALLLAATTEGRVLVTENVVDFPEIAAALKAEGREHRGIVLVSSRAFPRTERGFGQLLRALDAYLTEHERDQAVGVGIHWLTSGHKAPSPGRHEDEDARS